MKVGGGGGGVVLSIPRNEEMRRAYFFTQVRVYGCARAPVN